MTRAKKSSVQNQIRTAFVTDEAAQSIPVLAEHILADQSSISPPNDTGDPTGPSRDRYRDRKKKKAKGKIGDIISDNPIISGKPGKIRIPVDPDQEPIFRPGRDQNGQGGGPGAGQPGEDPGEFIEVSFEEFIEMFFEALGLPNMLKKMFAESMVRTNKRRGISRVGPQARINKHETAVARLKRASAMRNSRPQDFVDDFALKCQSVFEAYVFWAAGADESRPILPEPLFMLVGDQVEEFLTEVERAGMTESVVDKITYRQSVVVLVSRYLADNPDSTVAPYTVDEELRLRIEDYVFAKERDGEMIPTIDEVPFHKTDLRYNRIEEREDPDSKAMVGLILDRSGSMTGDPIVIAKAYFFICVLFLRTKYKHVAIIKISHDSQDYLWNTEEEFFKIGASGGTVAVPAWDLLYRIAEVGATCKQTGVYAGPFPASEWNRYMFHATDGQLFDGRGVIQHWWTKIIEAPFNYAGYLECVTSWGSRSGSWESGGEALLGLPDQISQYVGMARAASLADVPEAFAQILDKDRQKGA